ncbi:MAG: metal ABC transporter ATP-binding protein [Alphaproteobacteria bacterium]|nr:metal ABC transporter ATP-binding protein [Alphaproteobacteria bacterium]
MSCLIDLHGVTLGYERHPAVHHLHGAFEAGTLTAVVGPNGGGKSTLLKGIMGLLRPLDGHIVLRGLDRRDIAYLPQQADIVADFPISVLDTVLLGHWRRVGAFRAFTPKMRRSASRAISGVGLEGFEARLVGTLSAGQRQRVLFARVLVADSPVILLDEPFTAIDTRTTADLLALVLRWHGEGRTVVAVLHDHEQVRRHFPRTLMLAREAIGWGDTASVLTPANLLQARAMSEAWDDQSPLCERSAA